MDITLNSQPLSVAEASTVASLLDDHNTQGTAIAINGSLVRRNEWESTLLQQGDQVIIITAAYGG